MEVMRGSPDAEAANIVAPRPFGTSGQPVVSQHWCARQVHFRGLLGSITGRVRGKNIVT
jgi:hypothetical protein